MDYPDYIAAMAPVEPQLAAELGGFHNLERVLAWMKQRGLPLATLELVTQDEFSHDVRIPLENRWLVFGIS